MAENKFTLTNIGGNKKADVIFPPSPYLVDNNLFTFYVKPKSEQWNFGFRFSKNRFIETLNHLENEIRPIKSSDYKEFVFKATKTSENPKTPKSISFEQFNFDLLPRHLHLKESFISLSEIKISLDYDYGSEMLLVTYEIGNNSQRFSQHLPLSRHYRYFKILAWAESDWVELECHLVVNPNVETNLTTELFQVGNITYRKGDMFDSQALADTSVLVLPASSKGTATLNIRNRARELGINSPPPNQVGSVLIYSVPYDPFLRAGYAYTVEDGASNNNIISKVCRALIALDKNVLKAINMPLLGTGSGNLDPLDVANIYDKEFNHSTKTTKILVSVQSNEVFQKIRELFEGRYVSVNPLTVERPELITNLEEFLGITLKQSDFSLNRQGKITSLVLKSINVKSLNFLKGFTDLRRLSFYDCQIDNCGVLITLKALNYLIFSRTRIKDYRFIEGIAKLESLDLSSNNIVNLDFVSSHWRIRGLTLSANQINDITALAKLKHLVHLNLSNNVIVDVEPLRHISNLAFLDISNNQIQNILPITHLTELETLNIRNNKIEDLNLSPLFNLKLEYLSADTNPYVVKNELVLKENENHLPIIQNFILRQNEKGKRSLILPAKVLLLGNHASGKSSLLQYIQQGKIKKGSQSTHIIKIEKFPKNYNNIPEAIFFDFGGQDYYHGIYRAFLSAGSIYIILWNTQHNNNAQRKDSRNIQSQDFTLEYWLCQKNYLEQEKYNVQDPVLIVQSHSDKDERVSGVAGKKDHSIKNEFYVSLESTPTKSEKVSNRQKVNEKGLSYLKESLLELIQEKRIAKEEPAWYINFLAYILQQNSKGTYKATDIKDILKYYKRKETAKIELLKQDLEQLHRQGLILYYSSFPEIAWLNPVALAEYVHKNILKTNKIGITGRVPEESLKKYDTQILNLLCEEKVLFEISKENGKKEFIIPNFLPLSTESQVDFDLLTFGLGTPVFTLKFECFLPFGLINQIISSLGKFPDQKKFWRDQLLFTLKNRAKVLINMNFQQLQIKVYCSFFKTVDESEKENIVRYLFYCVIGLYWDFQLLDFDDYISFLNKELSKDSFEPEHDMYSKLSSCENIYENQTCRPIDLYISTDEKHYIHYADLYSLGNETMISSKTLQEDNTLVTSKLVQAYAFQPFSNKKITKMKQIFISYSKHDEDYKEEFRKHLVTLKEQKLIDHFNCKEIDLGADWDATIQREINECDILICLVSVDFLNTEYIRKYEVAKAIELGKLLIPIIIKPCDWEESELGKFFAAERGHTISVNKELALKNEIKETTTVERAGYWTKIVKEIRAKVISR